MKKTVHKIFSIYAFLASVSMAAQEVVPFSSRFAGQVNGNMIMTGNDIVGALLQNGATAYSNPNDSYNENLLYYSFY